MSAYFGYCAHCGANDVIIDTTGDDNNHVCDDCLRDIWGRRMLAEAEAEVRRRELNAIIRDIALRTP